MRKNSGLILLHNIVIFLLCALLIAESAGTAGRSLRVHLNSLDLQRALQLCGASVLHPAPLPSDGPYEIEYRTLYLNDNMKSREVLAVDRSDNSVVCSLLLFEIQK